MKTVKLDYITDPGHGWVKCSWDLARKLDLVDKISSFSYTRNGYFFLEEDCDAPLLLTALKAKGVDVVLVDKPCRHRASKVRSYMRYDKSRPLYRW